MFWLGMLFQILFGIKFKQWGLPYLPLSGMTSRQFPEIVHLILPAVTLASVSTAYAARITRSQLLEVMGQDYMRTAAAKGLTGAQVIWGHGMKNALIPVVTYFGLDLGAMMGGTVLTETVFNWPGIGYEIFLAIGQRDWPVVIGATIIIVLIVMVLNLMVDVSYAFLDPRIRLNGARLVMKWSPVLPILFLVALTALAVRSLADWLKWWGYPFLVIGGISVIAALIGSPVLGIAIQAVIQSQAGFLPSVLTSALGETVSAVSRTLAR